MSDQDKHQEDRAPQRAQKGAGGKDSKLQKRNKNVTSALTDRKKESDLEAEVNKQLASVEDTVFEPWHKRIIELQSKGWSFEKIIREGEAKRREMGVTRPSKAAVMLPSRKLLYQTLAAMPALREECDKAFAFAVDGMAQETIELADSLDAREGLKPYEWVQARDKRIGRRLHVAGRLMPDKWGERSEADREVIVFEPMGGWMPQNVVKAGSPGQGTEADEARERWAKMRLEAVDGSKGDEK